MKRKPGRPPGRKQVNASPAQGTTSKKRQVLQAKPPLNRRKASVEQTKASKTTIGKRKSKNPSKDGTPREAEGTSSENLPIEEAEEAAVLIMRF
ncbi:hypothetical protein YC2023_047435 [Brassica napus]